jgi:uroporphyrinogen decarboxylase
MTSRTLSPRERLIAAMTGGAIDRLPFGIGLGYHPWGETLTRWKTESGNPQLNYSKELGYDPDFRRPPIHEGFFPALPRETLRDEGDCIVFRDERGIVKRQRKGVSDMPEFLEHPVRTPQDWERIRAEHFNPDHPGRILGDLDAFAAQAKADGAAVQVGTFPWGMFGTARDLIGVEELLMWFYDQPEIIHDIMQRQTDVMLATWTRVAAIMPIDHIHIWEDMCGKAGPLIGPAMMDAFMMPCYDRISTFAKEHNIPIVSVDTDGECSLVTPVFLAHGINVMMPFEVQAGCDIRVYRKQYPTLGIWGGLDKRALALGTTAIDEQIAIAAELGKQGCFVPQWDHLIPPDVSWENFSYACKRLQEVCYQTR